VFFAPVFNLRLFLAVCVFLFLPVSPIMSKKEKEEQRKKPKRARVLGNFCGSNFTEVLLGLSL